MWPGYAGTITNLKIALKTQNQATQKNNYQNFFTPQNPEIENFKPKKIL